MGPPGQPTTPVATAGNGSSSVSYSATTTGGSPILDYTVTSSPGGFTYVGLTIPSIVSGSNGTAYTYTVVARNALGNSIPSAASNSVTPSSGGGTSLTLYANGALNSLFPPTPVLSFGATINYTYSGANVCPGSTQSLEVATNTVFGGGFQPGSTWTTIPPNGFDDTPYTQLQFSLKTSAPASMYVASHYSRSTGNDINGSTSWTQGSTCLNIPANTWTTVTGPLSSLALLGAKNEYKFVIGSNSNITYYLDNIKWIGGNLGWAFQGTGAPASGWTDASSPSTADYTWLPQTLNPGTGGLFSLNNPPNKASQFTASASGPALTATAITLGAPAIGDTVCWDTSTPLGTIVSGTYPNFTLSASAGTVASRTWASAPAQAKITGCKLTAGAVNGFLKLTNAGYGISSYTTFTFGVIPTKSGYGYKVQFLDTTGALVGNSVNTSSSTTQHDFGISTGSFTVHNMLLSAFGAIGSTIGGFVITETSANATNVTYFSAIGFYS